MANKKRIKIITKRVENGSLIAYNLLVSKLRANSWRCKNGQTDNKTS